MPASAPSPPTYRQRLQLEGAGLAACGAAASAGLLVFADGATDVPASTIGQLALVAVLLAVFGPRSARSAVAGAQSVSGPREAGSGEPTPLWHLPLVVAILAVPLVVVRAPDAALRVTGGCVLVGLTQALVLARMVASDEVRTGRTYVRVPGSRILRGTRLGWWTEGGVGARPGA